MKKYLDAPKIVLLLALTATTICIVGFRQTDSSRKKSFRTESAREVEDTIPPGKRTGAKDEFRMEKLNDAMRKLDMEMSQLDEHMKKLDFSKMQKEIDASISKVDWNKMQVEINEAVAQVKKVDLSKMHEHLARMKVELDKETSHIKIDAAKVRDEVTSAMEKARGSIEKARDDIKQTRAFTNALKNDGLIDKTQPYKIQVKDGELYINDKKQPKEVSDKYRQYFKKDNFSINSGSDDDSDEDII